MVFLNRCSSRCRHSFEYLDRVETIVAHMVGGVDAFIKFPQGWPVLSSPLKLISLKSSDHSKEISLTFLCKVEVSVIFSLFLFLFFPHCFFFSFFILFFLKSNAL